MSKERRRFPRVNVKAGVAEVIEGLGAQLMWSNLEISRVLDLSYRGAAVTPPGLFAVAQSEILEVELRLGHITPFLVEARVARKTLDQIGLDFVQLSADGHQAMAQYLDYKLIGTSLKPIDRSFFSPNDTFNHWYQAPGGVHVLVWMNADNFIERVTIDVEGQTHGFERGRPLGTVGREPRKALLILSQMERPELDMDEFLNAIGRLKS